MIEAGATLAQAVRATGRPGRLSINRGVAARTDHRRGAPTTLHGTQAAGAALPVGVDRGAAPFGLRETEH